MDVSFSHQEATRTARNRATLAKWITEAAERHGATVSESPYQDPGKERNMEISFGAYRARVHLDGKSRNDSFVVPWYTEGRSATYPPAFIRATGICSINEFHRAKATGIVSGVGGLLLMIDDALTILRPFAAGNMAVSA